MTRYIILLSFLVLNGCATNIHLTTHGYTNAKVVEITQLLKGHGFKVIKTDIAIPKSYPNNVIAMNPAHQKTTDIPLLQSLLAKSNIEPASEFRFGESRHYYSKGHLGLYLRHPDINPNAVMPPYLQSIGCPTGYATLAFQPNQLLLLETEVRQNGKLELHTEKGHWSFDGNLLIITLDSKQQAKFIQSNITRSTQFGEKPGLLYSPILNNHQNDALKCHFEIIFVN